MNSLNISLTGNFLSKEESAELYQFLIATEFDSAEASAVVIYGKKIPIPRKQCAFGDQGTAYSFSGTTAKPRPWTPLLLKTKEKIEAFTGEKFNYVLVNLYENGTKYIGYHRDDESDLLEKSSIASLSLGASRDFLFKHRDVHFKSGPYKEEPVHSVVLENGSLLMMKYPTNKYWYHSLPKRLGVKEPRINLTFRSMHVK